MLPLGAAGTTKLLMGASRLFRAKGMDWRGYYNGSSAVRFPTGPAAGSSTHGHPTTLLGTFPPGTSS